MSSTTAVGAVPWSHKKLTDECCVCWAMKMMSRTRTKAATTTAVQLALTRVRKGTGGSLEACFSSPTFDIAHLLFFQDIGPGLYATVDFAAAISELDCP
jgi:hypothetical protein